MSGAVIRLMTQAGDNLKLTVTVRCWSGSNGASVGEAVNTGSDLVSRHSLSGLSRRLSAILVSVFLCCFSISFCMPIYSEPYVLAGFPQGSEGNDEYAMCFPVYAYTGFVKDVNDMNPAASLTTCYAVCLHGRQYC